MHDHRDGDSDQPGQQPQDCGPDGGSDGPGSRGGAPDARFLQLEMSRVLYAEAEGITKRAVRELLVEAAKARVQERFGDKLTALAELAVDELLDDVLSSLDIEARIQGRSEQRGAMEDRLRDIFADGGTGGGRGTSRAAKGARGKGSARRGKRT